MIVDGSSEIGISLQIRVRHGGQLTIPGMRILVGKPTLMDVKPSDPRNPGTATKIWTPKFEDGYHWLSNQRDLTMP